MSNMYFVKLPLSDPTAYRMGLVGGPIQVGKQLVVYQGPDKATAQEIAGKLRHGELVGYEHVPKKGRVIISRGAYRDGQRIGGVDLQVLPDEDTALAITRQTGGWDFTRLRIYSTEELRHLRSLKEQKEVVA